MRSKKSIFLLAFLTFFPSCGKNRDLLSIVYTVRNYGNYEEDARTGMGGFPARKFLFKKISAVRKTIILDAGNFLPPPPEKAQSQNWIIWRETARIILEGYVRMGYVLLNPDVNELSLGTDFLLGEGKRRGLEFVSFNVKNSLGNHIFKPVVVRKFSSKKIMITGFSSQLPFPEHSLKLESPQEFLKDFLNLLDAISPQIVILLGNFKKEDRDFFLSSISNKGKNLTLYIDGASFGYAYFPEEIDKNLFLISSPGGGFYAGEVLINLKNLTLERGRIWEISGESGKDRGLLNFIRKSELKMKTSIIGVKEVPEEYAGVLSCKNCHLEKFELWKEDIHSRSYENLGERINDTYCLKCHMTGWQFEKFIPGEKSLKLFSGVQCEGCHGAGREHIKSEGKKGLLPAKESCKNCHNSIFSFPLKEETEIFCKKE